MTIPSTTPAWPDPVLGLPPSVSPRWAAAIARYVRRFTPLTDALFSVDDYAACADHLAQQPPGTVRRVVDIGCGFGFAAALFADRWRYLGCDVRRPWGAPRGLRQPIPFFGRFSPRIAYRLGHFPEAAPPVCPGDVAIAILSVGYEAAPPDPATVADALARYPLVYARLAAPYHAALARRFPHVVPLRHDTWVLRLTGQVFTFALVCYASDQPPSPA